MKLSFSMLFVRFHTHDKYAKIMTYIRTLKLYYVYEEYKKKVFKKCIVLHIYLSFSNKRNNCQLKEKMLKIHVIINRNQKEYSARGTLVI